MAGGEVTLTGVRPHHIAVLLDKMEEAGVGVSRGNGSVTLKRNGARLKAVDLSTRPVSRLRHGPAGAVHGH